jgi:predicted NAD-dependent protein-ADP-ribosyltransferase YbiA (DUF1768 family)
MARFADAERIRLLGSPEDAKLLARNLRKRQDWNDKLKLRIMTRLIDIKFLLYVDLYRGQGFIPELTAKLLGTGEAVLIEDDTGKILMEQRAKIQALIAKIDRAGATTMVAHSLAVTN